MDTRTFVNKVKQEANLSNDEEAKKAISAVLTTLHSRIPEGEADDVEATLPTEIKKLWEGTLGLELGRKLGGVEKMNKAQFLGKVRNKANLSTAKEAESISKAVIKVLKEAIPPGEINDLEAQLPQDLEDFIEAA